MGTPREVFVPDIGDFKNVDVIEVLVKRGDAVQPEQSLITVESDKATMEIPSPAAGVVKEMRVKTGDKVSQGSPILILKRQKMPRRRQQSPPRNPKTRPPQSPPRCLRPSRHRPPPRRPSAGLKPSPTHLRQPPERRRTRAPRCASSRASWASTLLVSRARARKDASRRRTSRS